MTNDLMLGGLYLLMAVMLVLGMLMTRREPWARTVTITLAWLAIFGGGFIMLSFRDEMGYFVQRLASEATGEPTVEGSRLKIPQAIDGHFYVDAMVNGTPVRFLVDSGATVTTVGRETAALARLDIEKGQLQVVQTGNGMLKVAKAHADTLDVGTIDRRNVLMHVTREEGLNVLGMNFLSSLRRWGVEGRWLVLEG